MFASAVSNFDQRVARWRGVTDIGTFSPYALPGNAAQYSLDGDASDSTYLKDGSNRLMLVADRSGNSAVNGLVLNGSAGNYASAPDSAATSITGDIDIRFYGSLADWTPTNYTALFGKLLTTGNQQSYLLGVASAANSNFLDFAFSANGSTLITKRSTVAPTVSDGAAIWIRVTLDVDNGAGGYDVKFYTSSDGITWTQLGATVTTATPTSIFDGTAAVIVGGYDNGAGGLGSAFICHRAQIYNGIAGTLAFDANFTAQAKLAASFTESSSNAATVTINTSGDTGARICGARDLYQGTQAKQAIFTASSSGNYATFDGVNDYMKAAPFSLSQPESVYLVGSQVAWSANKVMVDGNAADSMDVLQANLTPQVYIYAGVSLAPSSTVAVGSRGIWSAVFNSTSSSIRANTGAANVGNAGTANAGGATVGGGGGGASNANMTFSELLIRSNADDAPTQLRIAGYEIRKWNIV